METHPVQAQRGYGLPAARVPQVVTLRAYEVYCSVFAPQEALITGECRGGFSVGELIAFLYARSFQPNEWHQRFDEAIEGIQGL